MSNTRIDQFDNLAAVFKALSNPNRLKIFVNLASCCTPGTTWEGDEGGMRRCVGELGEQLSISPSTVSHHLKALRDAGLIVMQRRGQSVECWVDPQVLRAMAEFFNTPLGSDT